LLGFAIICCVIIAKKTCFWIKLKTTITFALVVGIGRILYAFGVEKKRYMNFLLANKQPPNFEKKSFFISF